MALPAQVRQQSDSANKLIEELGQQLAGGEKPTPPAATADPPAPVPAAPSAPPEQRPDARVEVLEQKYRTLQGMYNADTARLNQRVQDLENLLATAAAAPQPKVETQKFLTDKDTEEYGDSIEVMRRAAREEASAYFTPVIEELRAQVDQLKGMVPKVQTIEHRQTADANRKFYQELSALVPDWEDINVDQGFQAWLLEVDTLTGLSRQTFLEDAERNKDVGRVAAFFKNWPGAKPATPPAQGTQTSELEKQVSPGRPRTASPAPLNDAKVYTREEVAKFFRDVTMGVYKGQDAEKSRIERDIFAAQREGRIAN